jgi:hypothetical protein
MMSQLRCLLRCEQGSSIVELALALPIFSAMLIGIVDLSRAYSSKLQVEQAAQRAIEKVQQYQASASTFSTMKAEAAAAAGITATATNPTVDWWLECDGARAPDYSVPCSSGQIEARWIEVRVETTFTPYFASNRWPGSNADGTYTIAGEAGIRTQ